MIRASGALLSCRLAVIAALLAVALTAPALPAVACTVTLPPLPPGLAAYRIWGFRLAMRHAAVEGMHPMPVAWLLRFDNNENFITAASGNAIVGAAELDPPEVTHLFSITPELDHTCADLERLHVVRLTLILTRFSDDRMIHFAVNAHAVRIGG